LSYTEQNTAFAKFDVFIRLTLFHVGLRFQNCWKTFYKRYICLWHCYL